MGNRGFSLATTTLYATIYVVLFVIALAVVGGILGLLVPDFPGRDELLGTIGLVAIYTLSGPVVVVAFRKRRRWVAAACLIPLVISLLIWLTLIWFDRSIPGRIDETLIKIGFTCLLVAAVVLYHGLIEIPRVLPWFARAGRAFATGCAVVAASILLLGMWTEDFDDWMGRTVGVVVVLAVGGLFAVFALAALNRIRNGKPDDSVLDASSGRVVVPLTCPRCLTRCDTIANRASRCPSCHLKIRVEVEEPRCDCGYLLHGLTSETCPECGRAVPEHERWAPQSKRAESQ